MNHRRSIWLRFWAWYVIPALLLIIAAYRWYQLRLWTLVGRDGHPVCQVRPGWTEQEVLVHCGPRSGRGMQPKVAASGSGRVDLEMCSAPGDVYGTKVVLYGCDGRVRAVANASAQGFIYSSQDEPVATPTGATATSNEVSQALIGKTITIHGRFSLHGVIGPYILLDNQEEVYLIDLSESLQWRSPYTEMQGKLVEASGILKFDHWPADAPRTDKQGRLVARSPDFFYFDRETTQLRLIGQ